MSVCHLSKQSIAGRKWLSVFLAILAALRPARLLANPTGMTVGSGTAVALPTGSQLNITVGPTAILNWQSFNIGAGETTSFLQPSANSVVFNLIGEQNPSQIFGNLNANGTVILANANGFYFGPNSMIKVGGSFIATTAPLAPDWGTGSTWQFIGMPPLASIVNYGKIEVGAGKSLYLSSRKKSKTTAISPRQAATWNWRPARRYWSAIAPMAAVSAPWSSCRKAQWIILAA